MAAASEHYAPAVLIIGILCFGILVGTLASFVVPSADSRDFGRNIIAGLAGSLVGGTLFGLLSGDGFRLRLTGLIGSAVGAVIVLVVLNVMDKRSA